MLNDPDPNRKRIGRRSITRKSKRAKVMKKGFIDTDMANRGARGGSSEGANAQPVR